MYKTFKEVALLVAGSFLAVVAVGYEELISVNRLPIFLVLVVLIFLGVGGIDRSYSFALDLWKHVNKSRRVVGIYAPFPIEGANSSWVSFEIRELEAFFRSKGVAYKLEKTERGFKRHKIMLNPYGGVYPEKDLSAFSSLDVIFNFVKQGGIYINVADIPFYYAFDDSLNRRTDTTPLAGDFSTLRSFFQTLLTKRLHRFVLGYTQIKGVSRIIQLFDQDENLYSSLVEHTEDEVSFRFSPVLKIAYGKGYFIFSTLHLKRNNLDNNLWPIVNTACDLSSQN